MTTSVVNVPSGSTSAVLFVTPTTSVLAGPAVLGGTTTLSFSPSPAGPNANFLSWSFGASSGPQSFRPLTNGYIQVSAATQASNVALSEMSGLQAGGSPSASPSLISVNESFASASSTSEQVIGSFRVAPGLFPLNARIVLQGNVSMVNNGNAKTLQVRIAGVGGTLAFQSPALASNANYNFQAMIALRGDGVTQAGFGAGSAGGFGLSTTAYTSYTTLNYQQNEIEYVVTCTKATAGDLMQLESLTAQLVV